MKHTRGRFERTVNHVAPVQAPYALLSMLGMLALEYEHLLGAAMLLATASGTR